MSSTNRFIGQAKSAIDGKGRCAFPREFRRQLAPEDGTEFALTRWSDGNLRLFVMSEYEKYLAEVDSWSDRKQAAKFRILLSTSIVELDGQNRILLPKDKIAFAGLSGSVTFVESRGKSLELWNSEKFDAENSLDNEDILAEFNELCYKAGFAGGSSEQK